jgi:hypothetical protein
MARWLRENRNLVVWVVVLTASFVPLLLPEWLPSVGVSGAWFNYFWLVVVLIAIMLLAIPLGLIGVLLAWWQKNPLKGRFRVLVVFPSVCILVFAFIVGVQRLITGDLPMGSRVMAFDGDTWRDEESAAYVQGDVTPRQKMLGDVVANVLPGRSRTEIEAQLGPSLDTPYLRSTGRDLIYVTGPERNPLGLDSEWLLIWLDDSGMFERYDIGHD